MKKKGQVTTFVILGIIIAAALIVTIYMKQDSLREVFSREKAKLSSVPEQAKGVSAFIDSCVDQVAKDGITLLASQGGYIEVPEDSYAKGAFNPFSNLLEIFPGTDAVVPYWFYEASNNVEKQQIPTIDGMERQIEMYIDENIIGCLDYSVFMQQGYAFNDAEAVTEVDIGNENVLVSLNYPLKISLRDFDFSFGKFYREIEMPLGELHKEAVKIMSHENSGSFLENKTLDFMAMYDKIPLSGIDFDCNPRTWTKTQVIEDFRKFLEVNVPFIKVKGTDYEINDEFKVYEVDAEISNNDMGVNFLYSSEWPFFIDFIGEKSEVLRGDPQTTEGLPTQFVASLFCLNNYNFVYDVKYPVLITLSKDDLIFNFATMVVIDNNQPRQNLLEAEYDYTLQDTICQQKAKDITVVALGSDDSGSYKPLIGAKISYKCSSALCDIGETSSQYGSYSMTGKFPQCVNGFIIAEKEGYNTGKQQFSTTDGESATVMLDRIYELDLDARVVDNGVQRVLAEGESMIFNLENSAKNYATSVVYPAVNKIRLVAGEYTVNSLVSVETKDGFKLDEYTMKSCFDVPADGALGAIGITKRKCVDTKIEPTTLKSMIAGGANYEFRISTDDLAKAKGIKLYSVRNPLPRTMQEIAEVSKSIDANRNKVILPEVNYE
ncbi:MAG TPA: hypothetical protein VJC07_05020 [Candidatus Nanoarchaeia archaeon]|nr:hypothetical protein [Candidatus Nanoarchaeia archaeon]